LVTGNGAWVIPDRSGLALWRSEGDRLMDYDKPSGDLTRAPLLYAGERNEDYRARIAAYQAEAAERRQQELLEQRSAMNTPASRIRLWELLHQIALPRIPSLLPLGVLTAHTGLSRAVLRD